MSATPRIVLFGRISRKKTLKRILYCLVLSPLWALADNQTGKWGDQGDGTYRNPIIAGDYSDPDVIRVGTDYYMATSTFQWSPGVAILHSKDLVNWDTIGAAFSDVSKLGSDFNWDRMNRYNEGVYAPSIRYHDGKFWVFVNCHSGEGFYQSTATNPAGPWTSTQILDKNNKPLRTHGWTDPCPLFDDDGKAYLASSRPGGLWHGYMFQMTPDGTQLLDANVTAMNRDEPYAFPNGGTTFSAYHGTEGNKLFKRNGYYYLQHIEFAAGNREGTYVMRSRNIYGTKADGTPGQPGDIGTYEIQKFGNGLPGQGGFVDTPDGRWFWIGQFNSTEADGRKPNLLPVTWVGDWPIPGVDIQDKAGKMAWQLPKPIPDQPIQLPQGSDEFDGPTLKPQWFWNYQPRAEKWSLTERPGFLRLYAFKPADKDRFFKVGNILSQRYLRSDQCQVTIKLDVTHLADGQEAGLAIYNGGGNYATLGVLQTNGTKTWQYTQNAKPEPGDTVTAGTTGIWLQFTADAHNNSTFAYSLDGTTFKPMGNTFVINSAGYRGGAIGIYTFNLTGENGFVDADFYHYTVKNK